MGDREDEDEVDEDEGWCWCWWDGKGSGRRKTDLGLIITFSLVGISELPEEKGGRGGRKVRVSTVDVYRPKGILAGQRCCPQQKKGKYK